MKANYLLFLSILTGLASCEKIIQVDLNSVDPKLVVEANVTNLPECCTVLLSHSVNYYEPNIFPTVSGATVILSDNFGYSENLTEVSPGKYQTVTNPGIEGHTYSLKIVADGKEYNASSYMPMKVPIDSVNFEFNPRSNGYRVICKFKDPEGVLNYYKLQLSSNDTANIDTTNLRVLADGFADGQELQITYRTHLQLGDTVYVKLESIDNATYNFYRTITDVEGGLRSFTSAPPANPVTNISNGGLGYFSAHSVSDSTAVIQ